MFIDTRAASAPANILPKSKPILHTLRGKDPVELENHGYVSFFVFHISPHFSTPSLNPSWHTLTGTAPANILPKSKPILHTLRGKDPVELENHGYVSLLSLTFSPHFSTPSLNLSLHTLTGTVKKETVK